MSAQYIRHLKDTRKEHLPLVGGKGANLGELYARFAVPEGFCVTVRAFEEFLEEGKLKKDIHKRLAQLDVETVLVCDGAPIRQGGGAALRALAESL